MESNSPDPLPVFLASPPGSAATFDRPAEKLDQSENAAPFRPLSMVLRSHSRTGRSKSSEKAGGAIRTESENIQPETEGVTCVERATREIPDSPDIDSSGETGKTPSGPIPLSRQEPEMEIAACPPVQPPFSNTPMPTTTFFTTEESEYDRCNSSSGLLMVLVVKSCLTLVCISTAGSFVVAPSTVAADVSSSAESVNSKNTSVKAFRHV